MRRARACAQPLLRAARSERGDHPRAPLPASPQPRRAGSYAIKTVALDTAHTREELLDLRAKVKGDKHCH